MKSLKLKTAAYFHIIAFLGLLLLANSAAAETTGGSPSFELVNPFGNTTFVQIINKVLNFLITISIPILALMVLIGGFQILTARGDPGQITTGRKTIQWAVVGFLVILASKGVALILLEIIG